MSSLSLSGVHKSFRSGTNDFVCFFGFFDFDGFTRGITVIGRSGKSRFTWMSLVGAPLSGSLSGLHLSVAVISSPLSPLMINQSPRPDLLADISPFAVLFDLIPPVIGVIPLIRLLAPCGIDVMDRAVTVKVDIPG